MTDFVWQPHESHPEFPAWFAHVYPTAALRLDGRHWVVGFTTHEATRHGTRAEAVAAVVGRHKQPRDEIEGLYAEARRRNNERQGE